MAASFPPKPTSVCQNLSFITVKAMSTEQGSFRSAANHTHKQSDPEMVVALGPGKFYGSSLPRPRFYTDMKLNEERVDPPVPVLDPLISWAEEAHWSMGGLSFQRHRLQGRIEGNVKKLRAEREKILKKTQKQQSVQGSVKKLRAERDNGVGKSPVTPPAPMAVKRRRRLVKLVDKESSEEEEEREVKRTARKLGDDFDRVANDKIGNPTKGVSELAARNRSQRIEEEEIGCAKENKIKSKGKKLKGKNNGKAEEVVAAKGTRSSPRLVKGS